MELAARRRPHPQPGTAALLRHGASFPLAAANMPPPAGLGQCEQRFIFLIAPMSASLLTGWTELGKAEC